jgi:hypothetical protein
VLDHAKAKATLSEKAVGMQSLMCAAQNALVVGALEGGKPLD